MGADARGRAARAGALAARAGARSEPRLREAGPLERPDLYVVARFLDALWQPDTELTRSRLQRAVRLNYDLFARYLAFLEARGLVVVGPNKDGQDVVRLTPEGLRLHREMQAWLGRLFGDGL